LGHSQIHMNSISTKKPHAYAAGETYLPDGIKAPQWYQPVPRGLEARIAEKMAFLRKLDEEAS